MTLKNTIKLDKEFNLVYKKGKSFYGKYTSLRVLSVKKEDVMKVGVVVGLKVSKKAVVRNKKRRQVQEIIRSEIGDARYGFWLVVVVKKEIVDSDYDSLRKELVSLLSKSNIL